MKAVVTVHIVPDNGDPFEQSVTLGDVASKKVLSGFNPSADKRVNMLKTLAGASIQMMLEHQAEQSAEAKASQDSDHQALAQAKIRAAAVGITQTEIAQMCTVKALFAEG